MCFWLRNPVNGRKDLYWQSRDNALLIKGGANYSYVSLSLAKSSLDAAILKSLLSTDRRVAFTQDQINDDLTKFLVATLPELRAVEDFKLAVVGLRLRSEHEDDCCATPPPAKQPRLSASVHVLLIPYSSGAGLSVPGSIQDLS